MPSIPLDSRDSEPPEGVFGVLRNGRGVLPVEAFVDDRPRIALLPLGCLDGVTNSADTATRGGNTGAHCGWGG